MKIYSPTEVSTFMACPMKWALRKSGWYPNNFSYPEVTAAVGTGIHKGAYEVHKAVQEHGNAVLPDLKEMAVEASLEAAKGDIRRYLDNGCYPMAKVEDWEERIDNQVPKGVKAYIEQFPVIEGQIVGCEESFGFSRGESGYRGTIDRVQQDELGLYPLDLKTKQPFKSQYYKDVFTSSFEWSWQMYHYAWLLDAKKFGLIMIELKGKPQVSLHMFKVDQNFMARWLQTNKHHWLLMHQIELGNEVPGINNEHYAYGQRCPFWRACLDFKLDESLMYSEYVKLEV